MDIGNGKTRWIPAMVSEGLFSNENIVQIKLADGTIVDMFVDDSLIKTQNGEKVLEVIECEKYEETKTMKVLLPTETFQTSSRWVLVKS